MYCIHFDCVVGMWALFKLQKSVVLQVLNSEPHYYILLVILVFSLQELNLDDGPRGDMTKSILYKLSENGVFMYFRWVVFVSSPKDQYVPQYSARVQV